MHSKNVWPRLYRITLRVQSMWMISDQNFQNIMCQLTLKLTNSLENTRVVTSSLTRHSEEKSIASLMGMNSTTEWIRSTWTTRLSSLQRRLVKVISRWQTKSLNQKAELSMIITSHSKRDIWAVFMSLKREHQKYKEWINFSPQLEESSKLRITEDKITSQRLHLKQELDKNLITEIELVLTYSAFQMLQRIKMQLERKRSITIRLLRIMEISLTGISEHHSYSIVTKILKNFLFI